MQAKLQDSLFHDLRNALATQLVQSGVDLCRFLKMMGHCTVKMAEWYLNHMTVRPRLNLTALEQVLQFFSSGE